jgi:1-acyl-sn-glycerol-3-phosphate acyltransferase
VSRLLARWLLRRTGWDTEGERPAARSFVLVGAPHTSNWDLLWFLAITRAFDVRPRFMAKHTLFRWPMGPIMRWLGGLSVRRHLRQNVVDQVIELFEQDPDLIVAIPVEGTRKHTKYWKSGFYHIARGADVPVVPGYLDYARRRGGFGPEMRLTGDVRADMDRIRAFFADKQPRHPASVGEMRLREEDALS